MNRTARMIETVRQTAVTTGPLELRAALEQQRAFRGEQLAGLATSVGTGSVDDPQAQINRALRVGATSALRDIEAALARMDAGQFGYCESCDGDIAVERLEILPMAALCMPCASAAGSADGHGHISHHGVELRRAQSQRERPPSRRGQVDAGGAVPPG